LGAPVFAKPLARLFNLSLAESSVSIQWTQSRIHPIPKIPSPMQPSDFGQKSITPVLTKIFEETLVKQFHLPSFSFYPEGQLSIRSTWISTNRINQCGNYFHYPYSYTHANI
jgi:hypothetical protein